jgi:hypothetical protein
MRTITGDEQKTWRGADRLACDGGLRKIIHMFLSWLSPYDGPPQQLMVWQMQRKSTDANVKWITY